MSDNPERVNSLNVEAIIRGGLKRFTDQLGQLWCSLADYYIKNGLFERVSPAHIWFWSSLLTVGSSAATLIVLLSLQMKLVILIYLISFNAWHSTRLSQKWADFSLVVVKVKSFLYYL